MRAPSPIFAACSLMVVLGAPAFAQSAATPPDTANDPIRAMVGRLELAKYKATIKGLTQFGDRRQGTKRNRDAVDWIEAQLKSYGCTNTERIRYEWPRPAPRGGGAGRQGAAGDSAGRGGGRGGGGGRGTPPAVSVGTAPGQGGSTMRGIRRRTGVNNDSLRQPDRVLRALNAEPTDTVNRMREEVYCTKVGTTRPDEMYIVGGHMDGHGWGEAANDDGSGTA